MKAAITDSGAALQAFTAAQLYSSLVGEGEATLRDAFSKAKAASPAVIFLDEIDALAGNRDAEGDEDRSSKQILSSLLTEMDGLELAEGKNPSGPYQSCTSMYGSGCSAGSSACSLSRHRILANLRDSAGRQHRTALKPLSTATHLELESYRDQDNPDPRKIMDALCTFDIRP